MPFLRTPEEKAREVQHILRMSWPLGSVLPMKKMSEVLGAFPDYGIIYKKYLGRIYKIAVTDLLGLSPSGEEKLKVGGHAYIEIGSSTYKERDADELDGMLKKISYEDYGTLADVIDAGWMMD